MATSKPRAGLRVKAINFYLHCGAATLLIGLSAVAGAKSPESLLAAVGTIYCDGKVRGSAAHISPRQEIADDLALVVTAAHTLFDLQSGQPYKACEYRPQNKRLSGIAVNRISKHGYLTTETNKIEQADRDIAFLILNRRLHQPTLPLGEGQQPIDAPLALLGYHAALGDMALSAPCHPVDANQPPNSALLLHNCQAGAGTSGAPIVDLSSGEIVAIHGGALAFNRVGGTQQLPVIGRDQIYPSQWINQGRAIDSGIIKLLMDFIQSTPHN